MRFNATDGVDERWCGKLVPCAAAHLARYSQLPKGTAGPRRRERAAVRAVRDRGRPPGWGSTCVPFFKLFNRVVG